MTLSGLKWKASSPSMYHLDAIPSRVAIGYSGRAWHIAIDGQFGPLELPTREAAADLVAQSFFGRQPNA